MRRGRGPIAIVLVISLLLTATVQTLVRLRHDGLVPRRTASRLSGLDSFALGLVLGGLRGPLVLVLWNNIEKQKMERNLENIDTQIELLRMLQADFDPVHIFLMWNKAYNLSVQMASLPNKYATILEGLDYGRAVDRERGDNLNILWAMGDIYFNKLGDSAEKKYYIERVHQETLPHKRPSRLKPGDPGWQRTEHDAILDAKGFIPPEYLKPRMTPVDSKPDTYNGAELQYLARYNTPEMGGFPYGLSPKALGYNYYRRAAGIMAALGQKHAQIGDAAVDSRPAVALRYWADEEMQRARDLEIGCSFSAESLEAHPEHKDPDAGTASIPLDRAFAGTREEVAAKVREALFSFRRTGQVDQHAIEEYHRHMNNPAYAVRAFQYRSHVQNAIAQAAMARADHDFLMARAAKAGLLPEVRPEQIVPLVESARKNYRQAWIEYHLLVLEYFVPDNLANQLYSSVYPQVGGRPLDKSNVGEVSLQGVQGFDALGLPRIYASLLGRVEAYYAQQKSADPRYEEPFSDDIEEYRSAFTRAVRRLAQIEAYMKRGGVPASR